MYLGLVLISLASLVSAGIISPVNNKLRIVHGVKSEYMKPYLCSVLEEDIQVCGCSILDEYTVLTASHCRDRTLLLSDYTIGVGDKVLDKQTAYKVKEFTTHEDYNKDKRFNFDVAIIKLSEPLKMIPNLVEPIKLPSDCSSLPYGEEAVLAGWGAFNEDLEEYPQTLYETKVKVLKNTDPGCVYNYEAGRITENMFCAGWSDGKSDACGGDSGGPLVTKSKEQIGIVSWAIGCSRPDKTAVYTNVCVLRKWIEEKWNKK